MIYKPYLTDTNGQKTYEGAQVFRYKQDGESLEYGIMQLTPAEDENVGLYKWSVKWDESEKIEYWTGLLPLWTGNKPEEPEPEDESPDSTLPLWEY